jgi:hypothetical protein
MLDRGDRYGQLVWLRIRRAIPTMWDFCQNLGIEPPPPDKP